MELHKKLIGMGVVTIIALIALIGGVLVGNKGQMLEEREQKVRHLVEAATTVVAHFEQQERSGALTRDAAQQLAKDTLKSMRYDKSEYFWIHSLEDRMVMHPIKPEMDGKALDQIQDKNGKYLFREFNQLVKTNGGGFVDYVWPKPGTGEIVPKISYAQGFQPWAWVIASGIYIDDVDVRFRSDAAKLLAWTLGIGIFLALSMTLLSRNIIATLGGDPASASAVARRIAAGDLTTEVVCAPGDQSSLLFNIRRMQETLREMISSIVNNAGQVSSAANQLLHASDEVAERTRQQSDAAASMRLSVQEMIERIDEVRGNADEAHSISADAGTISLSGAAVIHSAAAEMRKISDAVQASSQIVSDLGHQSKQITSIVNTIKEIADQTNLLALNAAIEAARAGEQGRGFAVVADEVRKLAERTSHSTTEIADMVGKIQSGTKSAVSSMESGVEQAGNGVDLANQAGESINRIRDGALRVTQVVNGISEAIAEQNATSNEIAQRLETITSMSETSAQAVLQTADAARHLHTLSTSLHQAVAVFKT